jgi:hypothetical protein
VQFFVTAPTRLRAMILSIPTSVALSPAAGPVEDISGPNAEINLGAVLMRSLKW